MTSQPDITKRHPGWTITRSPRPGRPPVWIARRSGTVLCAPSARFLEERLAAHRPERRRG